jgi:hypothetical protein
MCSGGSSSKTQFGPTGTFGDALKRTGANWLTPGNRDAAMAQSFMSPSLMPWIGGQLASTASGAYLNPETNPYLQGVLDTQQQASNRNLQEGFNLLNDQFAKAGQYSSGTNSPLLQAQAQAIGRANEAYQESAAQSLFSNYGTERAIQQQALGALDMWNKTPINMASQLAQPFSGGNGQSSTSPDLMGPAIGAAGTILAAIAR